MRVGHVVWNLVGLATPLLIALMTIPTLLTRLGDERFGLLSLAWGLVGYAGALDLGIGRALTRHIAELRGSGRTEGIPSAIASALGVTVVSSAIAAALLIAAASVVRPSFVGATTVPWTELSGALMLLAIAIPAQAVSATYKGTNEAFLNFRGISTLRIGLGVVTFGGPYVVSLATTSLPWLFATITASRLLALMLYRRLAHISINHELPGATRGRYDRSVARGLLRFGGWVTVSGVLNPLMQQADRFAIAVLLGVAAVPLYTVPYDIVVQSLVLVGAVTTVAFPVLASHIATGTDDWRPAFTRWLARVAAMMAIVCLAIVVILPTAMHWWLGDALNPISVSVGRVLALGVFSNALGTMFFAQLHARGKSKSTALLHVVELPLMLGAIALVVPEHGVLGTAWVWVGRVTVDALALYLLTRRDGAPP